MKIGIYIENPEILRKILEEIIKHELPVKILEKIDRIDKEKVDIVITDVPEKLLRKHVVMVVRSINSVEKIVEKVKLLLKQKLAYNALLIGIDPGKRTGIAIIGDGEFLEGKTMENLEEIKDYVDYALRKYPYVKCLIRVGFKENLTSFIVEKLLDSIEHIWSEVILELVDENKTSRNIRIPLKVNRKVPKDVASAIQIALKKGLRVGLEHAKGEHSIK